MNKIAAIGLAAAIGTASLTVAPAPAKADGGAFLGGLVLGLIVGEYHQPIRKIFRPNRWHSHGYNGGGNHVSWCANRYQTYNPNTNLYYYRAGQQKHCVSPYS